MRWQAPTPQGDVTQSSSDVPSQSSSIMLHASAAPGPSMERAPDVDAMIVGEPEDAVLQLAGLESFDQADRIDSLTIRRNGTILAHRALGSYAGFATMPYPAWDLLPLERYRLPLENTRYLMVETSRGCPYSCDFCVAPVIQGHKFRERDAVALAARILQDQLSVFINFEETGELAEARRKQDKAEIAHEMADVFAWMVSIANMLALTITETCSFFYTPIVSAVGATHGGGNWEDVENIYTNMTTIIALAVGIGFGGNAIQPAW